MASKKTVDAGVGGKTGKASPNPRTTGKSKTGAGGGNKKAVLTKQVCPQAAEGVVEDRRGRRVSDDVLRFFEGVKGSMTEDLLYWFVSDHDFPVWAETTHEHTEQDTTIVVETTTPKVIGGRLCVTFLVDIHDTPEWKVKEFNEILGTSKANAASAKKRKPC